MRKTKGKFKHLTLTQRLQIEAWIKTKTPIRKIAELLEVHISTIYRELKRGTYKKKLLWYDHYGYEKRYRYKEIYSPDIAEQKYRDNLAAKGAPLKIGNDFDLANYIERKIVDEQYSPDAVIGEIRRKKMSFKTSICTTTLYSYIDKGVLTAFRFVTSRKKDKRKNARNGKRLFPAPRAESVSSNARKRY